MTTTKQRTTYVPMEGTLGQKVLDFFKENPEEELTRADIADKFDVQAAKVASSLVHAVTRGPLERVRNHQGEDVWRLRNGPFNPWPLRLNSGQSRRRKPPVEIDFSAIEFEDDVPLFERPSLVKQLVPVIERLQVKQCFKLPARARGVATAARAVHCKANPAARIEIRQISKLQIGIWRLA